MNVNDILWLVFKSFRQRGLRTWLTILGILIGVATLVSLVSVTEGMQNSIEKELQVAGGDVIYVIPRSIGQIGPGLSEVGKGELKEKDIAAIERVPGVGAVSPHVGEIFTIEGRVPVEYGGKTAFLSVVGVIPKEERKVEEPNLIEGRYLTDQDIFSAVIGYDVANDVFDEKISARKMIKIGGDKFRVKGILGKTGKLFGSADRTIFIPYGVARDILPGIKDDQVSAIRVKVLPGYDIEEVSSRIEEELLKLHNVRKEEKDFTVISPKSMSEMVGNIMGLVTLVMIGIASIALVVGGIGIMNTMLVSVVERTREIGILKAIGFKETDILLLFLAESAILGIVGGVLGIIAGVGLSKLVAMVGFFFIQKPFQSIITPMIVFEGLFFALVVGILSGLYPARKASLLNPVEALRYE